MDSIIRVAPRRSSQKIGDDVDEWTGATLNVIPPLPTELSDEDSGDEDDNSATINKLTGRFLREYIEVALKTSDQEEPDLDDQLSDTSFQEPDNQTETVVHEDSNLSTHQEEVKNLRNSSKKERLLRTLQL